MRYLSVALLTLLTVFSYSQNARINPHAWDHSNHAQERSVDMILSNDTTIDVKFYHLDVEIALDSAYINGSVSYHITSMINGLSSLKLDLDNAYTIDSISHPALSHTFVDNVLTITLSTSYNVGDDISFTVYYQGAPVLAGGYKGLRYENHDGNELIIASLSTPYLAHTWWPCKDGTEDKSDSTFIDITIKDTVISTITVVALSNGLLDTIEINGGKKTFRWRHYYPCVPYYIMVAISNYDHFQHTFTGVDYSFPIDYYVFESHMETAQEGVALLPEAMGFFTDIFGPYPFLNEKYAMTQLGYYGAIENQTNTITNNMSLAWLYVSVHELAHQWFADMITCHTWHHGWLNEGFASYAEALFNEYRFNGYQLYMENFEFYDAGTVYLEDVSNPYTVFQPIIYNKGAYVLHMLRGVVGDSVFFDIIYDYANDDSFMYKLATTDEFQAICEDVSGEELDYFFEQWIYDERFPIYYYNYEYNRTTGNLDVVVVQNQGIMGWREVFIMPMEIGVEFEDGTDTIINVINDDKSKSYTFELNKDILYAEIDPNSWILKNAIWDPSIIVGVNESQNEMFEVYPNPSKRSFNLRFEQYLPSTSICISVFDLTGKLCYERENIIVNSNEIEVSGLKSGIYFLSVIIGNEVYQRKLIVTNTF
ncbi:MAG: T9SS type A sorting domain-containing protein [Bacteroidetes bacterium]|nr:T9SS type A sorting domain-containing protein [Bacteroidota bacterium]